MNDRIKVRFPGTVDGECEIEARDGGIAIRLDFGGCELTAVLDHESAWRLSDELARVVSRSAVARREAAR